MNTERSERVAHLVLLCQEYHEYVRQTEQEAHDMHEHRVLQSERSVVHDQIIALFDELGLPYIDRTDVRRQALTIAQRGYL